VVRDESLRRVAALVLNLPPDARVWADESWPVETELTARVLEETNQLRRQLIAFNTKLSDVPDPIEVRRPWQQQQQAEDDGPIGLDFAAIKQFFQVG